MHALAKPGIEEDYRTTVDDLSESIKRFQSAVLTEKVEEVRILPSKSGIIVNINKNNHRLPDQTLTDFSTTTKKGKTIIESVSKKSVHKA